jgi:hypothetical protein
MALWVDMDHHHSPDLDLYYEPKMRGKTLHLVFEDGVDYSFDEAMMIAQEQIAGDDLVALHVVKRVLDGVLLPGVGTPPAAAHRLRLYRETVTPEAPTIRREVTEAVKTPLQLRLDGI